MSRRAFDFYPTPEWATRVLLKHVGVFGTIYEPCVGAGDIARVIDAAQLTHYLVTNDIDASRAATMHHDARTREAWQKPCDWVVSNPPFSDAMAITRLAHEHAKWGVAMLLRLSFLEPTEDRGQWLADHPPSKLIVMPRISFTGDGKTDSVTTAWLVWQHGAKEQRVIVVPKSERGALLEATA